jgi:hypothetical protein
MFWVKFVQYCDSDDKIIVIILANTNPEYVQSNGSKSVNCRPHENLTKLFCLVTPTLNKLERFSTKMQSISTFQFSILDGR